jgi:hypothetical protein
MKNNMRKVKDHISSVALIIETDRNKVLLFFCNHNDFTVQIL